MPRAPCSGALRAERTRLIAHSSVEQLRTRFVLGRKIAIAEAYGSDATDVLIYADTMRLRAASRGAGSDPDPLLGLSTTGVTVAAVSDRHRRGGTRDRGDSLEHLLRRAVQRQAA
jgi:hypothetical protein